MTPSGFYCVSFPAGSRTIKKPFKDLSLRSKATANGGVDCGVDGVGERGWGGVV